MLTLERIFLLKRRNWQNSHRFLGYCRLQSWQALV